MQRTTGLIACMGRGALHNLRARERATQSLPVLSCGITTRSNVPPCDDVYDAPEPAEYQTDLWHSLRMTGKTGHAIRDAIVGSKVH